MQAGDSQRNSHVKKCTWVGCGQEELMAAEDKAKYVKWIRSPQNCSTKIG